MRLIDGDELLARYKARCNGCKKTKNYCEHCCDIAYIISDIEDAPTKNDIEDTSTIEGWKKAKQIHEYDIIKNLLDEIGDERKKGKWMTKSTFMPDHYGGYYIDQYVCTNCESEFFKPSKFCPNCGADLRGKDEGNN